MTNPTVISSLQQPAQPSGTAAATRTVVRKEGDRPSAERLRANRFGGSRLKLHVEGTIEGYHLYWENDDNAAIEQRLGEGFEFVSPAEVGMKSVTTAIVADADLANRISKTVGKKEDGTPLRAYLLKVPEDIWDEIQAMGAETADAWDQSILNGSVADVDSRYLPKGAAIKLSSF